MRKTKTVTITAKGRDQHKQFFLTEMSAEQGEAWGMRALLALARSGVDLPEDFLSMGLAGMAIVGVQALAGLQWAEAKPLLAEMMDCVTIIPDPARPEVKRPRVEDDIEEISTLLLLRKEMIGLHLDFFMDGDLWTQARAAVKTSD
jgi:hypothetical protein